MATDWQKQQRKEQNIIGAALVVALAVQASLSFVLAELPALIWPAVGLGIVAAGVELRSGRSGRSRGLLAIIALVLAATFGLSFLVEAPRSALMMQLGRMVVADFVFVALGRLIGSFLGGGRAPRDKRPA